MMPYPAKTALCHSLQQGKFCYITEPTDPSISTEQLSLCEQARVEMERRGYRSLLIQVRSLINSEPTADDLAAEYAWDQRFIQAICHSLHYLDLTQLSRWLETTTSLSPRERLIAFTSDLLFNEICAVPFVILIENIDALRMLPSALDDILAWVEHCYELRDTYLTYHHLSFAVFSSEIIDQIILPGSEFSSNLGSIIETFEYVESHAGDRISIYSAERSNNLRRNCSPAIPEDSARRLVASKDSVSDQSQYAREVAEMPISAHKFRYDPFYCSYLAC